MTKEEVVHHADTVLTKATASSIATGSGGAAIARYGDVTESIRVILTDWAIPINVGLAIILGIAKLITMYFEFRWRNKEENRKETIFNDIREERRTNHEQYDGEKKRASDYENL